MRALVATALAVGFAARDGGANDNAVPPSAAAINPLRCMVSGRMCSSRGLSIALSPWIYRIGKALGRLLPSSLGTRAGTGLININHCRALFGRPDLPSIKQLAHF